jgi:hypothetical protein
MAEEYSRRARIQVIRLPYDEHIAFYVPKLDRDNSGENSENLVAQTRDFELLEGMSKYMTSVNQYCRAAGERAKKREDRKTIEDDLRAEVESLSF